jgi:hypothetical protein
MGDQFVKPAHFTLTGFQTHPVQLQGVPVDLVSGTRESGAKALPPFLDPAPPALQDPHPDFSRCAGEERQVHAKTVVLPGLWSSIGEQGGKALLAVCGESVHPPAAARPSGAPAGSEIVRRLIVFDDETGALQPA